MPRICPRTHRHTLALPVEERRHGGESAFRAVRSTLGALNFLTWFSADPMLARTTDGSGARRVRFFMLAHTTYRPGDVEVSPPKCQNIMQTNRIIISLSRWIFFARL
jgi:hypothetical protein